MEKPARYLEIYKSTVLTTIALLLAGILVGQRGWLNGPVPVAVTGGTVDVGRVGEVKMVRGTVDVDVGNTVDVTVINTVDVDGRVSIRR